MQRYRAAKAKHFRSVERAIQPRAARFLGATLLAAGFLFLISGNTNAQSHHAAGPYVPPPDPGYSLYYHDSDSAPSFAVRWGYHDGWEDGRHDRNHGDTFQPQDKDRFTSPPAHGGNPGISRHQFVKEYREAYTHGYDQGSRL